jgi:hypothetical protein
MGQRIGRQLTVGAQSVSPTQLRRNRSGVMLMM